MKKYNLSDIMKRAWQLKRRNAANIFGECLKMAWAEAKKEADLNGWEYEGMKFKNGLEIWVYNVYFVLRRWTKAGYDRVYINDGTRKGGGFVDLKTKRSLIRRGMAYERAVDIILSMEF